MRKQILFSFIIFLTFWIVTSLFSALHGYLPGTYYADYEIEENDYSPLPERTFLPPSDSIVAKDLWTYECEMEIQRPTTMTSACADFGEVVHSIKWSTWEKGKAVGTGIYSINDCLPDCADGTRHEAPVKVELRDLTREGNRYFLNTFSFESISEKGFPEGRASNGSWDISEFFRMVPQMHSE